MSIDGLDDWITRDEGWYDDSVCYECGKELLLTEENEDLFDSGFCSHECRVRCINREMRMNKRK